MTRSALEDYLYNNSIKCDKSHARKFLGMIKPYEDNEIKAEFDYEQLSKDAALLMKTTKEGQKFKEELIDPEKGFDE